MSVLRIRNVAVTAVFSVACGLAGLTPAAAAAAPVSQANGRFLSGQAGGTSFDTVASLNGESASYPGNPGPHANGLSGTLLGQAIAGPASNVSVPFPGGITLGAVGQYAKAAADGSATASSGLIGSNGAINVAGAGNGDTATVDLSTLPGASTLTDLLGNLTLHVGAVSAHAQQAAFRKKLSDPSAGCGRAYLRVSNADQAGRYQIAHLTLSATSPLLKQLGSTLRTNLRTLITQLTSAASQLSGVLGGLPDPTQELQVNLPGVSANLGDGSLTIDLAEILKGAGLDLNNLCPNTSLVRYLAQALNALPGKLSTLFTNLEASLDNVTVTLPGNVALPGLAALLAPFKTQLTNNFASILTQATTALDPALNAISQNLLDIVVNAQGESSSTFTETAVQVNLIPGGGSLPSLPGLPSFPGIPTGALQQASRTGVADAKAKQPVAAEPTPKKSSVSVPGLPITLPALPFAADRLDFGPIQLAAANGPVVQLNLASAAVTNAARAARTTSPAPRSSGATPASSTGTALPTGVPAGAAGHGGTPVAPLVIVLLGLVIAGGGWVSYRWRARARH